MGRLFYTPVRAFGDAMELLWGKPRCERCRHRSRVYYGKRLGKVVGWECRARQTAIEDNYFYRSMGNCWYFEKK